MAVRKFKPTTPGQRHKIIGTFEEITASVPEKSNSVLLISREIKTVFQQSLKQLNMIRTVRLVSLCCFMLMVKKDISLLLMDCK